jgi:hypothetical protein
MIDESMVDKDQMKTAAKGLGNSESKPAHGSG